MLLRTPSSFFFFFNDTATTEIYTLSLHDALPILLQPRQERILRRLQDSRRLRFPHVDWPAGQHGETVVSRSEEHTSELQSPCNLVCRLLLEKKKKSVHATQNPNTPPLRFVIHQTA